MDAHVSWMLTLFMLPYLALVGYDAALHPRRKTPLVESILHAWAGIAVVAFLGFSLLDLDRYALACLLLAVPVMLVDELGFHSRIGRFERRIHAAAFIALMLYVGAWAWIR